MANVGEVVATHSLSQLLDDIYIAWLAQQDPAEVPAELIFDEFAHFQIRPPVVRSRLDALRQWVAAQKAPSTQERFTRAAQRQAHHLALLLEMPSLRARWLYSPEEMLELARHVVAHPRTFNKGVRRRVEATLEIGCKALNGLAEGVVGPPPAVAQDLDEERVSEYLSFTADARDRGRIQPLALQRLRDAKEPWLTGREARFPETTNTWVQHKLRLYERDKPLPSVDSFGKSGLKAGASVFLDTRLPWKL
jgi:hypothetical protein